MRKIGWKYFRILWALMLAMMVLLPIRTEAASDSIVKLNIKVTTVDGAQPPPSRIAKRMAASVNTVGEHVLIGRRVGEIESAKASYERIVKEVFDRILVGYTVEKVSITPGADTTIAVELAPWGDVVREVELEVDYGSLSPELIKLIQADMGNLGEKIDNVLIGLPIDAVDWAGGVSRTVIQELLASELPEFRTNIDVEAGTKTIVRLSLIPTGATIQNVHVSLRSHTIPNILLLGFKTGIEDKARSLTGLPVAFVERHRDYFTDRLNQEAKDNYMVRDYGLNVQPSIAPGTDTVIAVSAETTKYNIWLEGYLDIGRNDKDNTSARLHAGKYIGSRDEAYMEVNFMPSSVSWTFAPGWHHRIGSNLLAGAKYNITDKEAVLTLEQAIGPNWNIKAERRPAGSKNEVGVRYRMHDYLSAEYIMSDEESWLRLVGHL